MIHQGIDRPISRPGAEDNASWPWTSSYSDLPHDLVITTEVPAALASLRLIPETGPDPACT
jgi:hypothetical protein